MLYLNIIGGRVMKIGFQAVVRIIAVLFILFSVVSVLLNIIGGRDFDGLIVGIVGMLGVMLLAISPKLPND